jgi:hypothetical protein
MTSGCWKEETGVQQNGAHKSPGMHCISNSYKRQIIEVLHSARRKDWALNIDQRLNFL